MKRTLKTLRRDCRGGVSPAAMLLIVTIVAIGAVAGLATLRDQIVQEFGDLGVGLNNLDQSFEYEILIDGNGDGDFDDPNDCNLSASYADTDVGVLPDDPDDPPACIAFIQPGGNGGGGG